MKLWDWNRVLSFFTFEWQKKLIALGISALIFYYVNSLSFVEQSFTLPIQYRNLPVGEVIVEPTEEKVTIHVKGRAEKVRELETGRSIMPVVDLEHAVLGISNYRIELEINTPKPDMTFNLSREFVPVKVDQTMSATVPVKPSLVGTPREGFLVDEIQLDHKQVIVSGPSETVLLATNGVETSPIDISDVTNDLEQNAELRLPENLELLTRDPIRIRIRVTQKTVPDWKTNL
jgi:YbbR domain-containing protein